MHLPKVGIKRGNQKLGTAIQRKSLAAAVDTFQNVEGISEAFVGGTVGVISFARHVAVAEIKPMHNAVLVVVLVS
eukprot:gene20296-20880_t